MRRRRARTTIHKLAHTHTHTRSAPLNGIVWVRCGLSLGWNWLRPGEIGWLDNAQHSHVACCILMKCLPGAVGASPGSTASTQRSAAWYGAEKGFDAAARSTHQFLNTTTLAAKNLHMNRKGSQSIYPNRIYACMSNSVCVCVCVCS